MADSRKHVNVGEVKVFDTETIYARAIGLQYGQRSPYADSVMAHELSHRPCLIMREAKTKANLKNAIKVEVSSRDAENDV